MSIAAITQRIDQYFCNLANHHFYICTIWCMYFYHLLSFLFKVAIRIPCPYFLFWFFLNWTIIVDVLEKNQNNRTHKHMDGVCVLVVYKSITSGTFVIAGPSSSFSAQRCQRPETLKFLAVFLKGVKCRGYINAKIQITLDTNSSWAICYLCIPMDGETKQNKTVAQKWPEISSVQMCEKKYRNSSSFFSPFLVNPQPSEKFEDFNFWKKKKFRLFSFITQKIFPIREL
jgi:hypothetical protein